MRRAFLSCQFPMPNKVKERQGTPRFRRRANRRFLLMTKMMEKINQVIKTPKNTPWFRPQFNETETSSDDQDEV